MKKIAMFALLSCLLCTVVWHDDAYSQTSFDDALVDAADRNAESTVSQLLRSSYPVDSKGKFGVTALMRAAYRGNDKIVTMLLNVGANPNSVDVGGATALHLASREGNLDVATTLLKYEAFVDMTDNDGWTSLMRASLANKPKLVRLLIGAGADVNAANKNRETPLMHAVQRRNIRVAELLLAAGANPDHVNSTGFSVLEMAKRKRNPKLEKLIADAVAKKSGKAADSKLADNADPESFKHKNMSLEVKESAKAKKFVAKKEVEGKKENIEIIERMEKVLSKSPPASMEPAPPVLSDIKKPNMPESLEPNTAEMVAKLSESDVQKEPEIVAQKQVVAPVAPPPVPAEVTELEEEFERQVVAKASNVPPVPRLKPYEPISGTPWLTESGQNDLIAKLKQMEDRFAPIEPESVEEEIDDIEQTIVDVKEEQVVEAIEPPAFAEVPPTARVIESTPWNVAEVKEPETAEKAREEIALSEIEDPKEVERIVESKLEAISNTPPPERSEQATPRLFKVEGNQLTKPMQLDADTFNTLTIKEAPKNRLSLASTTPPPVQKRIEKPRAPQQLARVTPPTSSPETVQAKKKEVIKPEPKEVTEPKKTIANEPKKQNTNTTARKKPANQPDPKPVKPSPTPEPVVKSEPEKQVAAIEQTPEQIVPKFLRNDDIAKQEDIPARTIPERVKDSITAQNPNDAKVEVSEAIPVPLSEPRSISMTRNINEATDERRIPRGFSPSAAKGDNKYWLEIRRFSTEQDAIAMFDKVTERENLYLRMRIIKPAKTNRRSNQVALRVGTFDTNKEAADICLSFKEGALQCAIIRDVGKSSTTRTARNFRLGYERGAYKKDLAFKAPSGGGYYWLQLGTFTNEFEAIGLWKKLSSEHGDILDKLKVNLTTPRRTSSASQALRLRAGPFLAKAEANQTCRRLKKRFVSCLAVAGK